MVLIKKLRLILAIFVGFVILSLGSPLSKVLTGFFVMEFGMTSPGQIRDAESLGILVTLLMLFVSIKFTFKIISGKQEKDKPAENGTGNSFFQKYKNRIIKLLIYIILAFVVGFVLFYLSPQKFPVGTCIESVGDEYFEDEIVVYIADYKFREYTVLYAQDNGWGNPVKSRKEIIESETSQGVSRFNPTECPRFGNPV